MARVNLAVLVKQAILLRPQLYFNFNNMINLFIYGETPFGDDEVVWTAITGDFSDLFVSHGSGSAVWLDARTEAELDTYFTSNTYNVDNTYYYYDSVIGEIR